MSKTLAKFLHRQVEADGISFHVVEAGSSDKPNAAVPSWMDVVIALDLRPWIDPRNGNIHNNRFLKVIRICFQIRIEDLPSNIVSHQRHGRQLHAFNQAVKVACESI